MEHTTQTLARSDNAITLALYAALDNANAERLSSLENNGLYALDGYWHEEWGWVDGPREAARATIIYALAAHESRKPLDINEYLD